MRERFVVLYRETKDSKVQKTGKRTEEKELDDKQRNPKRKSEIAQRRYVRAGKSTVGNKEKNE